MVAVSDDLNLAYKAGRIESGVKLLVAERDRLRAEVERQDAEIERLRSWLQAIEGGQAPITDESALRQMAYDAIVLGHRVPEEPK